MHRIRQQYAAGLDLCQSLREEHKNRVTQLFVRTGQPGMAPERTVLDRYDINGYFTKVEATEDKLYSLVKSGVRQYLWNVVALGSSLILQNAIAAGDDQAAIIDATRKTLQSIHFIGDAPAESRAIQAGVFIGDQLVGMRGLTAEQAEALRQRLSTVKSKAASLLAAADPFTESVDKGGTTYYRARFAGLDKDKAEAACKYLKRNDVECVTIKN